VRNSWQIGSKTLICLSLVIVISAAISTIWLLRVPFLQETDEQAHADYVYALYDSGGWFNSRNARAEDYVTKQIRYLVGRSNFWDIRVSKNGRAPRGYGSQTYFRAIDHGAPRRTITSRSSDPSAIPYVAFNYPVAYYALAAIIMRAAAAINHGSLVTTYFAARGLGVVCLTIMVALSFSTLRALKYDARLTLWITLAIGIMPLASWVSSYIQPDNLVVALTALAIFASVRWREAPFEPKRSILLLISLVALFFAKQHYGLVVAVAVSLMVLAFLPVNRTLLGARTLLTMGSAAVLGVAWICATTVTPIGTLHVPAALFAVHSGDTSGLQSLAQFGRLLLIGLSDIYLMGNAGYTYWLAYGDNVTPYIQFKQPLSVIQQFLAISSAAVALLMILRQIHVVVRLINSGRRHLQLTARIAFGDVILNLYATWVFFLLTVYAASNGVVYIEGRYFLPILLPTILLSVRYLPYLFRRKHRKLVPQIAAGCWVTYSITMTVASLFSLQARYYSEPRDISLSRFAIITGADKYDGQGRGSKAVTLGANSSARIVGLAASTKYSLELSGINATIDGRAIPVEYSYQRRIYYGVATDSFAVQTPRDLKLGRHELAVTPQPAASGDDRSTLEIDVIK